MPRTTNIELRKERERIAQEAWLRYVSQGSTAGYFEERDDFLELVSGALLDFLREVQARNVAPHFDSVDGHLSDVLVAQIPDELYTADFVRAWRSWLQAKVDDELERLLDLAKKNGVDLAVLCLKQAKEKRRNTAVSESDLANLEKMDRHEVDDAEHLKRGVTDCEEKTSEFRATMVGTPLGSGPGPQPQENFLYLVEVASLAGTCLDPVICFWLGGEKPGFRTLTGSMLGACEDIASWEKTEILRWGRLDRVTVKETGWLLRYERTPVRFS